MAKQMFKFLKIKNGVLTSPQATSTRWYQGSKNTLSYHEYPELCKCGFHASPSPALSALSCSGNVIALVSGMGKEVKDAEKSAFAEMKIDRYWVLDDRFLFDLCTAYAAAERVTKPITIRQNVMTNYGPLVLKGKSPSQRVSAVFEKLSHPDKFDVISDIALWAQTAGRDNVIMMIERTFMAHLASVSPSWAPR
jgi:hypothetical protein